MGDTGKNSILIVDDEKSNIVALTRILGSEYTIHAARNGADALEVVSEHLPDIILLDIMMPDMDGFTVIDILKKSERTRAIPVIFITGLDDPQNEEKGLSAGAADYISKPFRAMTVQLRIRNQIQIVNYIRLVEQLSLLDQLTGLPNRRSFDERLILEWNRATRDKTPISILMIDLDRFKDFNDTYGHQQGDLALKALAGQFALELKRSVDYVARWGGEEFVVLLTNTSGDNAVIVAERLRACAGNAGIQTADAGLTAMTISIGVNTVVPEPDCGVDDFIRHADEALYFAKNSGRNTVCRYERHC